MVVNFKIPQSPQVTLYASIGGSDTSIRLTPFPSDLDGNQLTMAAFGVFGTATIDPKVSGYEEIIGFTGITDNGDGTCTLTGVTRDLQSVYPYTGTGTGKNHGSSATVVFGITPQVLAQFPSRNNDETIYGQWTFAVFPITPSTPNASSTVIGMTKLSMDPAVPTNPIAVGINDTTTFTVPGMISPYAGRVAPASWLICDGSAVSRSTYANLFSVLAPSKTITITVASPAVFSAAAHGFLIGDKISLTTTGALPTGLSANTDYFIIASGFTSNAFELALSPTGAAINTSGSQSGVHTAYVNNFGKGDGATTFNLPDLRSKTVFGLGQGTETLTFEASAVSTGADTVTILNNEFPYSGQPVVLTTTGGLPAGLSLATTYYIIRASGTTIKFATSLANANAATAIDLTTAGSGIATITYTMTSRTNVGITGGEENHLLDAAETPSHTHTYVIAASGSGGNFPQPSTTLNVNNTANTSSVGGDTAHNNMSPFMALNYIIKI